MIAQNEREERKIFQRRNRTQRQKQQQHRRRSSMAKDGWGSQKREERADIHKIYKLLLLKWLWGELSFFVRVDVVTFFFLSLFLQLPPTHTFLAPFRVPSSKQSLPPCAVLCYCCCCVIENSSNKKIWNRKIEDNFDEFFAVAEKFASLFLSRFLGMLCVVWWWHTMLTMVRQGGKLNGRDGKKVSSPHRSKFRLENLLIFHVSVHFCR